ncbi:MAG: Asp-tRNA(Asn)/Glu-tRNA(Gln) amidotransferase subunit GatC [Rickettsiales bacterium]|nr:MAG: Asp-tRNA(Asn)/Glu-tRNA(Gln) amidotransferase subunit GatC [Rickettsiales bacterium]
MISNTEFKKLEKLTKLSFLSEDAASFMIKLDSVLKMIDTLKEVECENIEPLRSVSELNQFMRPDEIINKDISDDLFKNIPSQGADFAQEVKCFVVPKVIE